MRGSYGIHALGSLYRSAAVLAGVMLIMSLAGCGQTSDEVKRIEKADSTVEAGAGAVSDQAVTESGVAEDTAMDSDGTGESGYIYHAQSGDAAIEVSVDMPMEGVLAVLGEPDSYFEAKSCAFEGLDKMYTYAHYEIDTYPSEDGDKVSAVFLTDDLTGTSEGLYIGSTKEEMESIYGTDYEVNGSECTYRSGDMSLKIQLTNDKVSYITYASKVLGTVVGN